MFRGEVCGQCRPSTPSTPPVRPRSSAPTRSRATPTSTGLSKRRPPPSAAGPGCRARAGVVARAGEILLSRKGELAELVARECGKVLVEAGGDVQEAVDMAHYVA